jgi:hypothetical protein
MRRELLAGSYIQADETPVDVQTHDGSGTNHQAYLLQYGTPGGMTVFDFRMSRKRKGPLNFLGNFEGLLQTDGYAAYDRVGGPKMVHAACWSHARRYFVDAVKLNKQDAGSIRAVELINELFAIDAQAQNEKMNHAARHVLRHEKATPLLDEIRTHILGMSKSVLPSSTAGQACRYTLAIWQKLIRFLDYPDLELSNNLAENSMRPIALGRGNWIHIGSEPARPRVAAIISVIESCRRLSRKRPKLPPGAGSGSVGDSCRSNEVSTCFQVDTSSTGARWVFRRPERRTGACRPDSGAADRRYG